MFEVAHRAFFGIAWHYMSFSQWIGSDNEHERNFYVGGI